MKPYLCTSCASMNNWNVVESDNVPKDDMHNHGWREASTEEADKSAKQTLEEHEMTHEHMGGM